MPIRMLRIVEWWWCVHADGVGEEKVADGGRERGRERKTEMEWRGTERGRGKGRTRRVIW